MIATTSPQVGISKEHKRICLHKAEDGELCAWIMHRRLNTSANERRKRVKDGGLIDMVIEDVGTRE